MEVEQKDLLKLPIYFFLDGDDGYKNSFLIDDFHDDHSNLIGDIAEYNDVNDVNDDNVSGVRWKFKKVLKSQFDKETGQISDAEKNRCFIMNLQNNTCEPLVKTNENMIEFISPANELLTKYNSRIIDQWITKSYETYRMNDAFTPNTNSDNMKALINQFTPPVLPIGTNVYPICHSVVITIINEWIKHLQANQSPKYNHLKTLYENMKLFDENLSDKFKASKLIQRFLTKRPLVFVGAGDDTRDRLFKDDVITTNGTKETVQNYMMYDECIISALIGVSNETYTLRTNPFTGTYSKNNPNNFKEDNRHKKVILVGQCGARFERNDYMESTYINSSSIDSNSGIQRIMLDEMEKVLNDKDNKYLKQHYKVLFDNIHNPKKLDTVPQNLDNPHDDNTIQIMRYLQRLALIYIPYILNSLKYYKTDSNLYCRVTGIGGGVWLPNWLGDRPNTLSYGLLITLINMFIYEKFSLKKNYPNFNIELYIGNDIYEYNESKMETIHQLIATHKSNQIKIIDQYEVSIFDKTNHSENDCIVCQYAWDGNSFPGNEYWYRTWQSADPAFISATALAEIQNPILNPFFVNGYITQFLPKPETKPAPTPTPEPAPTPTPKPIVIPEHVKKWHYAIKYPGIYYDIKIQVNPQLPPPPPVPISTDKKATGGDQLNELEKWMNNEQFDSKWLIIQNNVPTYFQSGSGSIMQLSLHPRQIETQIETQIGSVITDLNYINWAENTAVVLCNYPKSSEVYLAEPDVKLLAWKFVKNKNNEVTGTKDSKGNDNWNGKISVNSDDTTNKYFRYSSHKNQKGFRIAMLDLTHVRLKIDDKDEHTTEDDINSVMYPLRDYQEDELLNREGGRIGKYKKHNNLRIKDKIKPWVMLSMDKSTGVRGGVNSSEMPISYRERSLTTQHIFTSDINLGEVMDKSLMNVEDKFPDVHKITLEGNVMTTTVKEKIEGSIWDNRSEYNKGDIKFNYDDDDTVKKLIWDKIKSILGNKYTQYGIKDLFFTGQSSNPIKKKIIWTEKCPDGELDSENMIWSVKHALKAKGLIKAGVHHLPPPLNKIKPSNGALYVLYQPKDATNKINEESYDKQEWPHSTKPQLCSDHNSKICARTGYTTFDRENKDSPDSYILTRYNVNYFGIKVLCIFEFINPFYIEQL